MTRKGFSTIVIILGIIIFLLSTTLVLVFLDKQKTADSQENGDKQDEQSEIPKKSVDQFEDEALNDRTVPVNTLGTYDNSGDSVEYKCFDEYIKEKNDDFLELKQTLELADKSISNVCFYKDMAIGELKENNTKTIRIFTRTNSKWNFGRALLASTEINNFRLIDWTDLEDIVFVIFHTSENNIAQRSMSVYRINLPTDPDNPKLIETCNWGIGGGLALRSFTGCADFNIKDSSSYIQSDGLP